VHYKFLMMPLQRQQILVSKGRLAHWDPEAVPSGEIGPSLAREDIQRSAQTVEVYFDHLMRKEDVRRGLCRRIVGDDPGGYGRGDFLLAGGKQFDRLLGGEVLARVNAVNSRTTTLNAI